MNRKVHQEDSPDVEKFDASIKHELILEKVISNLSCEIDPQGWKEASCVCHLIKLHDLLHYVQLTEEWQLLIVFISNDINELKEGWIVKDCELAAYLLLVRRYTIQQLVLLIGLPCIFKQGKFTLLVGNFLLLDARLEQLTCDTTLHVLVKRLADGLIPYKLCVLLLV